MNRATTNRRRALALAAAATVALGAGAATASPAAAHGHRPGGTLILVGGGLKDGNAEVYNEIVDRAGGAGKARIGVLTAASVPQSQDPDANDPDRCSNSVCNGLYYADLFKKYGAADAQWIPIDIEHVSAADSDEVVRQVESMTGFFFGGGDQYRYVTSLLHGDAHTDSKVLAAIRAKLAAGAVVAGSSAGAQIASGPDMVTGGDSYPALRDGSSPGYFDDATRLGYLPEGGFGFLRSGLIDTHTGTNGREGRSIRLAADTGQDRVFAMDEDTAIEVTEAGTAREQVRVLGTHGVAVLDLRAARTGTFHGRWSIEGVRYSYLTDGDRYDPKRWRAYPAEGKEPLTPASHDAVPANNDVFYSIDNPDGTPYSFSGTARALAATDAQRTATARTFETGPAFEVDFTKGRHYHAYSEDGATARTLTGLTVDLHAE
ncbi:cyanophycinase [Streptacidiphilus sp. ASG 303]|uniref:cyanophycinase n=1 Tax=Streptacidiphilus sp. ASG 303 TaxID=2896847 RepID=UPI001E4E5E82|nr:cyanophycinase [Streptacidiphilus sp. ASG 303]MCD0480856.1 cyanophycinase [Streptacidiphilus sp. ASG 303]